jgi:hypothetical protein
VEALWQGITGVGSVLAALSALLGWDVGASFWQGAIVVVIVGFVAFQLGVYGSKAHAPYKPQSVVLTTSKTPWQVFADGCMNTLLVALVLAIIGVLIIGLATPAPPSMGAGEAGGGDMLGRLLVPLVLVLVPIVTVVFISTRK